MRVNYGQTVHGEEEIEAVVEVLRTSTQMGKNVAKMEEQVAELFGHEFGVMVNSGSSALYLTVELLDLPAGSEVITPLLTFATTVAPLARANLRPAFVDVKEGTYVIDENKVEALINQRTKAIVVPNLVGNLPDWPRLREVADRHGLLVVEDSADTLGAMIAGQPSGKWADISITSFYGSHVINCAGNGGMLCTSDPEKALRAKLLRSWGRSSSLFTDSESLDSRFDAEIDGVPYDRKFVAEELGFNLEPSEMGAAFGLVQLKKLQKNIQVRNWAFDHHTAFFKDYENWFILPRQFPQSYTGWLAYPLTVRDDAPFTRNELQIYLERSNIQTRPVFMGNILRQPAFQNIDCRTDPDGYPETDRVMLGGLLIACHHGLDEAQIAYMHEKLEDFFSQAGAA